jgi:osmotically-inducible protein OsmY
MTRLAIALLAACSIFAAGCAPLVVGAAAAGTAMVAADRRSSDVQLADERIELQAGHRIGDLVKDAGHINITSYNRQVLLTGEATTDALKQQVERTAAAVGEVKGVVNEIQVAAPVSIGSRSNDTYLTSVVKSHFVGEGKFNALHVKVVTENGVVYLMGIVTRKEADDATNIARHVSGVRRVVRVFEYIAEPPPAQAQSKPPAPEAAK